MKTYTIGRGGHYRDGRLYVDGDTITVDNTEEPGPNWTLVESPAPAGAPVAVDQAPLVDPPKPKRPSDKSI